jgi:hypothetical protein
MWHGVGEYVAVAALVAIIVHALIPRYLAASVIGATLSSIGNMAHEAWLAGFQVNPGWAPFLFIAGLVLASPVSFAVGLPFLIWRQSRRLDRDDELGEFQMRRL